MRYYWVITGHYEGKKKSYRREVHIDKLSERELKNRLKSNYYGELKWLTIDGTMTMIHRLLESRYLEEEEEHRRTGFIIHGEEIRPIPVEVVTEYHLENGWLIHDHDIQGKKTNPFCKDHDASEVVEAEEVEDYGH